MSAFGEDGIEAAARAVNGLGWTCFAGTDEPGSYDSCADCRRVARDVVTAVIAALQSPDQRPGPGQGDDGASIG